MSISAKNSLINKIISLIKQSAYSNIGILQNTWHFHKRLGRESYYFDIYYF